MRFVLAKAGVLTQNGNIYTKEALVKLQDDILEKKVIQLKDKKGSYEAKVYHCFMDGDCLMVEVEERWIL